MTDLRKIAAAMGGEVNGNVASFPTPGHSKADRGSWASIVPGAPDGVLINSRNGGDPLAIKDQLRARGVLPSRERERTLRTRDVGAWEYTDAAGVVLYRKVRMALPNGGKSYRFEHPDGRGGWLPKRGDAQQVPYRLPDILAAEHAAILYMAEGEKQADKLASWGFLATSSKDWRKQFDNYVAGRIASVELHGNALLELIRDQDGTITGLRFIPWPWVAMQLLPSGRVAFDVYEPALPGAGAIKRRLLGDDVVHLKDRSDDGLIGRSRLSRARDVLLTATSQQTFARSFLDRGAQPSGVISHDGPLTMEQRDSLRRLNTDHIDLYQMHHSSPNVPWDEIWQAMDLLVQQGKVLYVGSSNFAGWQIATGHMAGQARGGFGLTSEQSIYNLMERTVELEVVPACRAHGLGLVCWSPLNRGLLGGVLKKESQGRRSQPDAVAKIEKFRPQLEAYEAFCDELGAAPADVALAWLLANPVVAAPLMGPRTVEQLHGALGCLSLDLSSEAMKRLDDIWPGPGGEAPMAYAW